MLCSLLVEPPNPLSWNPEKGSFALFVTPPAKEYASDISFARSVIFMLDRSQSMEGTAFDQAREALGIALDQLNDGDKFSVCAYDNLQEYWSATLQPVSSKTIRDAKKWVKGLTTQGLTDILTPVTVCLNALNTTAGNSIPLLFLITDGAVKNERAVCKLVKNSAQRCRVFTFGIGSFCNAFFLKMLATLGRGYCDIAITVETLYEKLMTLLELMSSPLLTDIRIGISGIESCETFPHPIPDLFLNQPLLISGQYTGQFPASVTINGTMSNGQDYNQAVASASLPQRSDRPGESEVPVGKICMKNQLDIKIAQAWLVESETIVDEIVEISMNENIPCAHTSMVAYTTDDNAQSKLQAEKKKNGGRLAKGALGVAMVGGFCVVGVSPSGFGDLGASLGSLAPGLPSAAGLAGLSDMLGPNSAGGSILNGLSDAGSVMSEEIGDMTDAISSGITSLAQGDVSGALGRIGIDIEGPDGDLDASEAEGGCCGCSCCGSKEDAMS